VPLSPSQLWPHGAVEHLGWLRQRDGIETELVTGGCGFSVLEIVKRAAGTVRPDWLDRIKRAAHVKHAALAEVMDARSADGSVTVRRRFIAGAALADASFDATTARVLLAQAAEALEALHAAGVAHGGIHDRNLVLSYDGIRLVDMCSSTRELTLLQSADYRAPSLSDDVEMLRAVFASRGVAVPVCETVGELRRCADVLGGA
jgi:hypothetical protein